MGKLSIKFINFFDSISNNISKDILSVTNILCLILQSDRKNFATVS